MLHSGFWRDGDKHIGKCGGGGSSLENIFLVVTSITHLHVYSGQEFAATDAATAAGPRLKRGGGGASERWGYARNEAWGGGERAAKRGRGSECAAGPQTKRGLESTKWGRT